MTKREKLLEKIIFSGISEESQGETIPFMQEDEDDQFPEGLMEQEIAILPLRNNVLFPGVIIPITVNRKKSVRLIKKAYKSHESVGVLTQKSAAQDDPTSEELYSVGTIAKILKIITLPDGSTTAILQGQQKFSVKEFVREEPNIGAIINVFVDAFPKPLPKESKVLLESLKEAAMKTLKLNPEIPQEAEVALKNIESKRFLVHFLCSNLSAEPAIKQELIETPNLDARADKLLGLMLSDIQMLEIKHEIHSKAHSDLDQQHRDHFMRQQIKVMQDELGMDDGEKEMEEMRLEADRKKWPEAARKHFHKEMDKLSRMNPGAPDFSVSLNYAEFMLELPWETYTKDNFDLDRAAKILDKDHFGLKKIKERIIEYLAVLKLKNDMKGPILCLYGPPGVGKTSLGKSIAKSLNRKYARISLGGLHDEGEIRGHRKTYVGAMAGKVLTNLKKTGSSNPVFVLDEIDKIGSDFKGDPASAFLEILDPEQNSTFTDNYLEVEYDLSKVLFIATANQLDTIHPALRDRMELIEVSGYTLEEKLQIAKKHLVAKQRKEHGLKTKDITFEDAALIKIIDGYTRESGVRNLEQKIAAVTRNIAKSVAMEKPYTKKITPQIVETILGMPVFDSDLYEDNEIAGVVTGLAWTQVGGEILFIESSLNKGKGRLTISGQLGDVMKESATTALSFLRAHAPNLGIDYRTFDSYDLHIHVPAGAVPKDGPSAGIAMLTSLASVFTQRKVKDKLAMTGEITLRGRVLPVGGLKEKILAAKRSGINEIILSKRNQKDIAEIEPEYLTGLVFHYVENAAEVLKIALLEEKVSDFMVFELENLVGSEK